MKRAPEDLPLVHLRAGEMHYSDQPTLVITVLGSCLSVILYHRRLGIGGICHGLLPSCGRQTTCGGDCPEKFTYVDCSIRNMVKLFRRRGAEPSELEVKCFGGADMFSRPIEKKACLSVGRQNSLAADEILRNEGLTVTRRDVGGFEGRKIFFYTHTGDVLLKRLKNVGKTAVGP